MLNRQLVLMGVMAAALAVSGCSKETEQHADAGNVEKAAESAATDVAQTTEKVGAEAVDGLKTAGAVAAGTVVNTGEAVANGANAVVDGAATAVADGATAVAQGAENVAASTEEKVDLQADPAVKEAVSENKAGVSENQNY